MSSLNDAIRAGHFVNIRKKLSQLDVSGRRTSDKDHYIYDALWTAANVGSVGVCRLLWGKLSHRGRRRYSKAVTADGFCPLHTAVKSGHLAVVRLFIEEFKWNINQKDCYLNNTPLCCAVRHVEVARYLLENGANVNQGGQYGPLWNAIGSNNTELARVLLVEYHANPNLNRRLPDEEDSNQQQHRRCTDLAIWNGNPEILHMLLEHGAFVGHVVYSPNSTSLNVLLRNRQKSREDRVAICRILIEHATGDQAAAKFLQDTFEFTIKQQTTNNIVECQRILLDSGIDTRVSMYCAIRVENLSTCQLLVREYQVDPFLQQEDENDDSDDETAVSPFLAAARLLDTTLFEYFLGLWNERFFASTGGKNRDGDYPIHVICCDPLVSLQAIHLLVNRHPDALTVVDGDQGLLPFHFAANWGASLDVIFFLLQHCPDALSHVRNAASASTAGHVRNDLDAGAPVQ